MTDYNYVKNKVRDLVREPYAAHLDLDYLWAILDHWPQENQNSKSKVARADALSPSHDKTRVFRPSGVGVNEEWATLSTGRIPELETAIDALRSTMWWKRCHRQSWPLTGMHLFAL